MATLTRRGLLKQTSLGAATAAAITVVPNLVSAQEARSLSGSRPTGDSLRAMREPLAAYVRDASTGEIAILVGTREIVVRDPELVRRLTSAAR